MSAIWSNILETEKDEKKTEVECPFCGRPNLEMSDVQPQETVDFLKLFNRRSATIPIHR